MIKLGKFLWRAVLVLVFFLLSIQGRGQGTGNEGHSTENKGQSTVDRQPSREVKDQNSASKKKKASCLHYKIVETKICDYDGMYVIPPDEVNHQEPPHHLRPILIGIRRIRDEKGKEKVDIVKVDKTDKGTYVIQGTDTRICPTPDIPLPPPLPKKESEQKTPSPPTDNIPPHLPGEEGDKRASSR